MKDKQIFREIKDKASPEEKMRLKNNFEWVADATGRFPFTGAKTHIRHNT